MQATLLNKLEANTETQATSLHQLTEKAEWQGSALYNLQAKADAQATLLNNLATKAETQETLLNHMNAREEKQAISLGTLESHSKTQTTMLNELAANGERQANATNNLKAKAELHETLLRNLQAKADTQANLSNNLATKEEVQKVLSNTLQTKSVMQNQTTSLANLESKVDLNKKLLDNVVTKDEFQATSSKNMQNLSSKVEKTVGAEVGKLSESIQNSGPFKANDKGIIAGTTAGVVIISTDSGVQRTISPGVHIKGVAFDYQTRQVYWIQERVGIMRASLQGTPVELIVSDTSELWGLAVDPITGNFYYGAQSEKEIRVCSRSGKNCAVVASGPTVVGSVIHDIALDPSEGILVWSNLDSRRNVIRANMDGTNATLIVSEVVYGISVDEVSHRLAWSNDNSRIIGSHDFKGSDRKVLLNATLSPNDVAVDENKMVYFGNWNDKSVYSVAPDGRLLFIASTAGNVQNIALYGRNKVYSRPNPCQNSNCPNVCVLNRDSFTCL